MPEEQPSTLVHGAPGLGLLVPAEFRDTSHGLITGEDVGIAPWQWDVGWVLAELRELRFLSTRVRHFGTDWQGLEHSFLSGYGRPFDLWVQRSIALRSLLHLHDFSVFVAWDEAEIHTYAALIMDAVDAADILEDQEGVQ
ncbi:hypothetical protein [Streptomyces sp. NPDC002640]